MDSHGDRSECRAIIWKEFPCQPWVLITFGSLNLLQQCKKDPGKTCPGSIPGQVGVPVCWERKPDKGLGWSPNRTPGEKAENQDSHAGLETFIVYRKIDRNHQNPWRHLSVLIIVGVVLKEVRLFRSPLLYPAELQAQTKRSFIKDPLGCPQKNDQLVIICKIYCFYRDHDNGILNFYPHMLRATE